MNKKGEGTSLLGTTATIVLLVIVIGAVVIGFIGPNKSFAGISNLFSPKSTVESVKSACDLELSRSAPNYCMDEKTLVVGSSKVTIKGTCQNFYDDAYAQGILNIGSMDCARTQDEQSCSDLGGKVSDKSIEGYVTLQESGRIESTEISKIKDNAKCYVPVVTKVA